MPEYGIDVSYHNGSINWAAVRANGITFATIKATSGESSGGTDSPAYFRAQAAAMARAIPLCGGYHWLKPISQTSAPRQVQTFLDVLQDGLGGYQGRLIQLDVEEGAPSDVRAWLAEWNRRTNSYPVALYLPDWLENQWGANRIGEFGCAAWWSSEYVPGQSLPYKTLADHITPANWHPQDGVPAAILQYTSQAAVGGVGGKCDVNIYRGTLPQLGALLTRGEDDMATAQEIADAVWAKFFARPDAYDDKLGHAAYESAIAAVNAAQRAAALHPKLDAIAAKLGVILAEVDGVEEGQAELQATTEQVLTLVRAVQAGDPDTIIAALLAALPAATAEETLDRLAARAAS